MARTTSRAVALAALTSVTLAVGAGAALARDAAFQTPSKRMGCTWVGRFQDQPESLRCDTDFRTRFSGRRRSCMGVYGQAFEMTARGRPRVLCVSDAAHDPRSRVLRYGATRRLGSFSCTSRTTGLRCVNAAGHGFALSRQRQLLF